MSPWKVIFATIVIFVCGLVSGVLIVKTTNQNVRPTIAAVEAPPTPLPAVLPSNTTTTVTSIVSSVVTKTNLVWAPMQAERMALIRQMVNRLRLDQFQKERISQIIKDSQERNKQLWQEIAPQMHEELKRVTDEIRQELRPPQLRHFNEMLRENRQEKRAAPAATNLPPDLSTNVVPVPDKVTNGPAS